MKVLHFHYGTDGGAERFFVSLVNELAERGLEQQFFLRPGRGWRGDVERCGVVHEATVRRNFVSRFFAHRRVQAAVEAFRPDLLMSWRPRTCMLMERYPGIPRLQRIGDYTSRPDEFRGADRMVVNTPDIARKLNEVGWKKPVDVISNFTHFEPTAPIDRAELQTPQDAFVVAGVGRFSKRKGFQSLIEAVAKRPGVFLWLVGEGEERGPLERLAAERGIADRVRFTGWQPNPAPYLMAADVFVMPSLHEPLGNVVLEAWSVGRPVVSSRSEGPLWMMTDGEDGLLADVGDAAGIADALARLQASPELRQRLVEGGRATLAARFSKAGVVDSYVRLFETMLQTRS